MVTVFTSADKIDEDGNISDIRESKPVDINHAWREFFELWWEAYGTRSVRVYEVMPLAFQAGIPGVPPNDDTIYGDNLKEIKVARSAFGTSLRAKHRHVHSGLRLISDRVERGWSKSTTRTTYHLEKKDEPRHMLPSFAVPLGESEED